MRIMKIHKLSLLILIALLANSNAICGEIPAEIIQYKLDRIYFSEATESNIYENCDFILFSRQDSIGSGKIEKSFPGLSFSHKNCVNYDTVSIDSIRVIIRQAEIDSQSVINIGLLEGTELYDFSSSPIPKSTQHGNPINVIKFTSFFEMTLALESGKIDLIASYKSFRSQTDDFSYFSIKADYFAAMIPNVESNLNAKGILTNSLYYRYNQKLFSIYYDGNDIHSYYNLFPNNSSVPRHLDYDPSKGKSLLRSLTDFNNQIDIAPSRKSLIKLSDYFEDILARDKINITNATDDIILAYIPINSENPGAGLDSIFNIMLRAAPLNGDVEENLAIVENYIDNGHRAIDSAQSRSYYSKAEKSLIEDFGVFPIYRPVIYFAVSPKIKTPDYDKNAGFDLASLKLIVIPSLVKDDDK